MLRLVPLLALLSLPAAPAAFAADPPAKAADGKTTVKTRDGKTRTVLTFDEGSDVDGEVHEPSVEFIEGRPQLTDDTLDLSVPEKAGSETVERAVPRESKAKTKK